MRLFDEIQEFIGQHRGCTRMRVAGGPAASVTGFAISLTCNCGAAVGGWVSADVAREELIGWMLLSSAN